MATESLLPFSNNPINVLRSHFDTVGHGRYTLGNESFGYKHIPTAKMLKSSEKIFKKFKNGKTVETVAEIAHSLTCSTVGDVIASGDCTTVDLLIELFLNKQEMLPENWKRHPDQIRTIMSIAAEQDLAVMRGTEMQDNYDKDLTTPEKRSNDEIKRHEKLINDLWARASIPETGAIS